ncbi:MAG TPA: RagB/SusD family nutrient uptake outer membrane protein [Bacteroidales bacterium]|nr:RagB/SusD family nutrient uptake outer membrane protein [Bacteroidales bacterium]
MKKILYILFSVVLLAGVLSSCSKDSLEPTLAQAKAVEGSINTVEDVMGLLYGAYDRITSGSYYGRDYIIWGEVRADNCFSNGNSGRFVADAKMNYTDASGLCWASIYQVIASANIVIGIDEASIAGDAAILAHYKGQAYAIRAMAHFDLLRYYGQMHNGDAAGLGVPYITVYKGEDYAPARNTILECKAMIEADIASAIANMNPAYDDDSKELFTHWAAHALKSRVAIYFGDWATAITASQAVINSQEYDIIPEAGFVNFWATDGGVNSIFELAYSGTDNNNINGIQQIYRGSSYGDVEGLQDLYDAFDVGDVRASAEMIGPDPDPDLISPKPYTNLGKYPSALFNDNIAIFRYEEVILNYAEALFRTGDNPGALTQLNLITANRGAVAHAGTVDEDMILLERRRELCFEGMRFHDLMRTGRDIPLPHPLQQTHEGPAYGSYNLAFPIPRVEMEANANMVQNTGYGVQ